MSPALWLVHVTLQHWNCNDFAKITSQNFPPHTGRPLISHKHVLKMQVPNQSMSSECAQIR